MIIHEWREAGLNTASTIRIHKLTVLSKNEVVRRLGELTAVDRVRVAEVLRRVFSLEEDVPSAARNRAFVGLFCDSTMSSETLVMLV